MPPKPQFTKEEKKIIGGRKMNKSICGIDCTLCQSKNTCKGCTETKGCPFDKQCFIEKYIELGGVESYQEFKRTLIEEINDLHIPGMAKIEELCPLVGSFVNLEYTLPSGQTVKFLDDREIYLGMQVECIFDDSQTRCFGVIASNDFLLISEYSENGTDAEIIVFKRR